MPWVFDWSSFAALAVITLLDGVRRVPVGCYLLRQRPGRRWHVADGPSTSARWRLVSCWSPVTLHCIVSSSGGSGPTHRRIGGWWVVMLRLLGGAVLLGMLVGIPLLTPMFGAWGLLAALLWLLVWSFLTAIAAGLALRRLGMARAAALGRAARLLWPFAAPRAAEVVLEHALASMHPIQAAQCLLPASEFAAWIRPVAYDALAAGSRVALPESLSDSVCQALVSAPPPSLEHGERFCQRCGGAYVKRVEVCVDCGLELVDPHGNRGWKQPGRGRIGRVRKSRRR